MVNKYHTGSGSNIQLVTLAQQIDAMAKGKVKTLKKKTVPKRKPIKRKRSTKKSQSSSKRRRVKTVKRNDNGF